MIRRATLVLLLCATAGLYAGRPDSEEAAVTRTALAELPRHLDGWHGADAQPFADDVVAQLGVDDYIHRRYWRAESLPVFVYVGYYDSQRQGNTIHSPQNCLPGAGWQPVESGRQTIVTAGAAVDVNRFVVAKGRDRQIVLFWYQGRGRVVANEYANKALLMLDAARLRRTNGGLVRLIVPVVTTTEAATGEAIELAGALLPRLAEYLP